MALPFLREFKLAGEDGDGRNAYLNGDGVFLGEGVALLEKDGRGAWRPRPRDVLERLLIIGYGGAIDTGRHTHALNSVARALNAGDKARAAMTLVHIGLPALPDADRARKMAQADALMKYSPDQPRVPAGNSDGGQWTDGSGSAELLTVVTPGKRVHPDGLIFQPGSTPLDPQRLSSPPTPDIVDRVTQTINQILSGNVKGLSPHYFNNFPNEFTGAILPFDPSGYTSYDIVGNAGGRGARRLYVGRTNGKYFYSLDHGVSYTEVCIDGSC